MKNLINKTMSVASVLLALAAADKVHAQGIVKTDMGAVAASGNSTSAGPEFKFDAGLYIMGEQDKSKWSGSTYVMVDQDSDDPNSFLVLMISKAEVDDDYGNATGYFYAGHSDDKHTSVTLKPLFLNMKGDLAEQGDLNSKSKVLIISRETDIHRSYPLMVTGRNGALNGRVLGMTASDKRTPGLISWPSSGTFIEGNNEESKIVVKGESIEVHNRGSDRDFQIISVNGDRGKFAALSEGEYDAITETVVAGSAVQKLAFFVRSPIEGQHLIVGTQRDGERGQFSLKLYSPRQKSFFDLFPGLVSHKN